MSREIRFRAWDGKQMQTDFNLFSEGGAFSIDGNEEVFRHENWIVMQFTGLKDKNGKEIYEGDVVQVYFYDNYKNYTHQYEKSQAWKDGKYYDDIKEVKFIHGSFVIYSDLIHDYRCFANLARPGEQLEIIGNIHETPELLK